jgi:hypothetical protein
LEGCLQKFTSSFAAGEESPVFSFQKNIKRRDPSDLRPQDDKERSDGVILSVSEESHFSSIFKS